MPDQKPTTPTTRAAPTAATPSAAGDVARFLDAVKAAPKPSAAARGRLLFALDATMSRQPTWDRATALQAEMFEEAARIGGLDVSLVYFRGFGECRASRWVGDARALGTMMTRIDCRGGHTQIEKVLAHAIAETRTKPVAALVHVGDAVEEDVDRLAARAGELGLLGVKAFLFQEGDDPTAARAFGEIARLTGGAHVRFAAGAGKELGALLRAVAAYAAGGLAALEDLSRRGGAGARLLIGEVKGR